jgi:predicted MFS family arabinose efflux permease
MGGVAFDHFGWQSTFILSAGLLTSAAVLTVITSRKNT